MVIIGFLFKQFLRSVMISEICEEICFSIGSHSKILLQELYNIQLHTIHSQISVFFIYNLFLHL